MHSDSSPQTSSSNAAAALEAKYAHMEGKAATMLLGQERDRASSLEQVRKKLRTGWRNDDKVLNLYFEACYSNWKIFKGPRTPEQVLKLQAIYKQAVYGDNIDPPPKNLNGADGLKWKAWQRLNGTPQEMAKRRFITFLAEIDPLLIDVMPNEKPPLGFPVDRKGITICAKCNTTVGCLRPLLDQNKMELKRQLYEHEELHQPEKFKLWIRNALENQRCVWGAHKPLSRAQAKEFMTWFNRDENRGFYPYDSSALMDIVKELVHYHHEVSLEMMQNKNLVDADEYNQQATKTLKLKEIYQEFTGEDFFFYVPCDRDNDLCNSRRLADGGKNHVHPVEIDPPTKLDINTMEQAVELRKRCQEMGINPCTGVVPDIATRCEIYRARIAEHIASRKRAVEAKERLEIRHIVHKQEKQKVQELSKKMLVRQLWDACQMNLVDQIMTIVRRGANPNTESPRGITPLICLILNDARVNKVEELGQQLKANWNAVNRYGLFPLMLACRMNNNKMVHALMRSGASALQKADGPRGLGRSALHWCAVHGADEMVKLIVEYLQEGAGDSLRVTRFLDLQAADGDTALMLAARRRNGLMCSLLSSLGANPNIRNSKGRTAAYLARTAGWLELAEWLEKKVSTGLSKISTFSDQKFDRSCQYARIKMRDLINEFGRLYLKLMQNRQTLHPLGCPFVSFMMVKEKGKRAVEQQRQFLDNHHLYLLGRDAEDYREGVTGSKQMRQQQQDLSTASVGNNSDLPSGVAARASMTKIQENEAATEVAAVVRQLRGKVHELLSLITEGFANPNTENGPKPLPWSPLMCAVCINDFRTVRQLIKEGADVNHPNQDGTTPVMLAAQLHSVEMLAELIIHKGDLDAVDNQGFSPIAYASSLPLPTIMDRDSVGVLLEGDADGPRPMNAVELIRLVMAMRAGSESNSATGASLQDLRNIVQANAEASKPEMLELHYKVMGLMEQYGLSRVDTERDVREQVRSADWRLTTKKKRRRNRHAVARSSSLSSISKYTGASAGSSITSEGDTASGSDEDELEEEENGENQYDPDVNFKMYLRRKHELEAARKAEEDHLRRTLRCPICTLTAPCVHFFKFENLKKHLDRQAAETKEEEDCWAAEEQIEAERAAQQAADDEAVKAFMRAEGYELDDDSSTQERPEASVTDMKISKEAQDYASTAKSIRRRRFTTSRKMKTLNRAEEILAETFINDRNTDRSIALANQFRDREIQVLRETELRREEEAEAVDDDNYAKSEEEDESKDQESVFVAAENEGDSAEANSATSKPGEDGLYGESSRSGSSTFTTPEYRHSKDSSTKSTGSGTSTSTTDEHIDSSTAMESAVLSTEAESRASTAMKSYVTEERSAFDFMAAIQETAADHDLYSLPKPRMAQPPSSRHPAPIGSEMPKDGRRSLHPKVVAAGSSAMSLLTMNESEFTGTASEIDSESLVSKAGSSHFDPSASMVSLLSMQDPTLQLSSAVSHNMTSITEEHHLRQSSDAGHDLDDGVPLVEDDDLDLSTSTGGIMLADDSIDAGRLRKRQMSNISTPSITPAVTPSGAATAASALSAFAEVLEENDSEKAASSVALEGSITDESLGLTSILKSSITSRFIDGDNGSMQSSIDENNTAEQISGGTMRKKRRVKFYLPTEGIVSSSKDADNTNDNSTSDSVHDPLPSLHMIPSEPSLTSMDSSVSASAGDLTKNESPRIITTRSNLLLVAGSKLESDAESDSGSVLSPVLLSPSGRGIAFDSSSLGSASAATADENGKVRPQDETVGETVVVEVMEDQMSANSTANETVTSEVKNSLALLQAGAVNTKIELKENPLPFESRKIFGFTRNFLHRQGETDGLLLVTDPLTENKTNNATVSKPPLHQASRKDAQSSPKKSAVTETSTKGVKRLRAAAVVEDSRRNDSQRPNKVIVSGWIFVSMASLRADLNPLESVPLSLETWGSILHQQQCQFLDEWLPQLTLTPVVNMRTWQSRAPRCAVCAIGFVRFSRSIDNFNSDPAAYMQRHGVYQHTSDPDENLHVEHLCLACALRRDLFQKAKIYFPRSLRQNTNLKWPFIHQSSILKEQSSDVFASNSLDSALTMESLPSELQQGDIPAEFSTVISAKDMQVALTNWQDMDDAVSSIGNSQAPGNPSQSLSPQQLLHLHRSPIASTKLAEIDAIEEIKLQRRRLKQQVHHIYDDQDDDGEGNEDDDASVHSQGSMISQLTESVAEESGTSLSILSTATIVDPMKKPKELALIPYLLAKGHFEEVERLIRIAIGKRAVDEGEGLKILIKLLTLQAEMYKYMGVWCLALANYVECVDLMGSLMGFDYPATLQCIDLVTSCMRKMQRPDLAADYAADLCYDIENETMKSFRGEFIESVKRQDKRNIQEYLITQKIWTEQLRPQMPSKNHLELRLHSVVGMGGFYALLTAQDGYSVVARETFFTYCQQLHATVFAPYVRFVDYCFRLRCCDDPEVYRFMIQHMIQKQLARRLIPTSDVARLYRKLTDRQHINLVIDFLKFGVQPTVQVFDALLQHALRQLLPLYRVFLLFAEEGSIVRDNRVEIIAEAYDVAAVIIQTAVRRQILNPRLVRQAQRERDERVWKKEEAERQRKFNRQRRKQL